MITKYGSWEDAARAAVCQCGKTWEQHWKFRPITLCCSVDGVVGFGDAQFRPDDYYSSAQVVEHEVNGVVLRTDQYGRELDEYGYPVRTGWKRRIKQLMMEEAQP